MIVVNNLTKNYGKIKALQNINFFFKDQQVIAIMGENGAGKSTLLKICAGILPFDSGDIFIDGYSLKDDSIQARKTLGYLPEMPEIYERLTGREFLFYIASLRKITNSKHVIQSLAEMIGINDFLDYEIGSYSKGMKQKISIISAIMHNPNNLLFDEPVYGLDPLASRTIQSFIKKRKGTTIIATHSTNLVEQVSDYVYLLMKGQIVASEQKNFFINRHGSIENAYFYYKDNGHV
ncbi:MAG: ABC transporter ATP-binding protein [Thermoplasmatota archaeon]